MPAHPEFNGDTPGSVAAAAVGLSIPTCAFQVFTDLLDRGYELDTALAATSSLTLVVAMITYVIAVVLGNAGGDGQSPAPA